MICFFGGRADLWPPLQNAVDRLLPRPPELLAILSRTFSDPARLTPAMLARADASVASLGQQVSPARIIRTGIAVAYLDRLSGCREPLQRAIQHGREGGAVTSAIEALFLLGQDAFHTGRWDEAQELVDEGLQLCDTHGYHLLTWPGRLTAALLSAARGDSRQAADTARDMDAWATPRRAGIVSAYAAHIRSLTALGQADFETAFRNAAAISPPGTFAPYAPHALWVFLDLVEAAIHTGRRAEAARPTSRPPATAGSTGSPRGCAWSSSPARPSPNPGPTPVPTALEQAITEPGQRPLALRPGPHSAHLRLPPAPHQAHHRRPPPAGRRRPDLPPARSDPLGGPRGPGTASHRHHRLHGRRRPGLPHPAAAPDCPARRGGPHQQGDRRPPLPLPANGLYPPLPGLPQARHHLPRRAPRRPRRYARRMTSRFIHKRGPGRAMSAPADGAYPALTPSRHEPRIGQSRPGPDVRLWRKTRRNVREQGKAARPHAPGRYLGRPGPGRAAGSGRVIRYASGDRPEQRLRWAERGGRAGGGPAALRLRGVDRMRRRGLRPVDGRRRALLQAGHPARLQRLGRPGRRRRGGRHRLRFLPAVLPQPRLPGGGGLLQPRGELRPGVLAHPAPRPATGETGTSSPPDEAARCTSPGTTGRARRT